MRLLLAVALLLPLSAADLKNLVPAGTPGTFTSAGSALPSFMLENRITAAASKTFVASSGGGGGAGNVTASTNGSSLLTVNVGGEGTPSGTCDIQLTATQDYRYRYRHDSTLSQCVLELWNGDCSGYTSITRPLTSMRTLFMASAPWTTGASQSQGFLRLYSTLNTTGTCPVDAPSTAADQFDFPYEDGSGGSLTDRSANVYVMSCAGCTFANSTVYSPTAAITSSAWVYLPVFRLAGGTILGSTSVCFTYPGTGACSSYAWTNTAGPGTLPITSPSASSTAVGPAPSAGQYTMHLVVMDAASTTATADKDIGFVDTDSRYVVSGLTTEQQFVMGNLLMHNASPWPWFEVTEAADVNLLNSLMTTAPTETAGPGTLTIPSGAPNMLNGDGNIEALTYGGVAVVGSGTNFTGADVGTRIVLHWDRDGDSSFTGRMVVTISSVVSATIAVTGSNAILEPPAKFASGIAWGRVNATNYAPYNAQDGNSNPVVNFYEAGLAVGRLWKRTQLTTYKTQFHTFLDNVWTWSLDSGYSNQPIARNAGLSLIFAGAVDPTYTNPTGLWTGLERMVQTYAPRLYTSRAGASTSGYNPTSDVSPGLPDARETSYITRWTAMLANLGGAHGLNQATWCGYLANQVNHMWIADAAIPTGGASTHKFIPEDAFWSNQGYPAAGNPPVTGPEGTSPWRTDGLSVLALIYAYEALNNPATCNDPTTAAQLYSAGTGLIPSMANYIWDYGRSPDGGPFYDVGYQNKYFTVTQNSAPCSITVANGSATVNGNGSCNFTSFFPSPSWIGINGTAAADKYVFSVSVVNANQLTLNTTWPGSNEAGITSFSRTPTALTSCGPFSSSGYCNADDYSGRNLSADLASSAAWLFKKTGTTSWQTRADTYLNKVFGGAATGSGGTGAATGSSVYSWPGTISVTNGSAAVVGTSTLFLTQFACNGTDTIVVADNTSGLTWATFTNEPTFVTRTVASCADNTHLTLSTNYVGTTAATIAMFYNPLSWSGADGGFGNLGEILPACGTAPCGSGLLSSKPGKGLGMCCGAGDVPVALVNRLGASVGSSMKGKISLRGKVVVK